MPKTFITEHDVEDMVRRGMLTIDVDDSVVLTDLAYEKAQKLGVRLLSKQPTAPPGAPVRPYLSQDGARPGAFNPPVTASATPAPPAAELQERIRAAVVARLGSQVDAKLLDVIIQRVLTSTGLK